MKIIEISIFLGYNLQLNFPAMFLTHFTQNFENNYKIVSQWVIRGKLTLKLKNDDRTVFFCHQVSGIRALPVLR